MMDAALSHLLVIDIQERLAPVTVEADLVVHRARTLLDAARRLEVPHTVSEQYPKGLGPTVEDVLERVDAERVFDKVHFSCAADDRLAAEFKKADRSQIIVCGMEAHVCVLQSVLGLLSAGYQVHVAADAITSRTAQNRDLAIARMRAAGAEIVSTEMVVFEWLRTAGHPDFREISRLIK